MDTALWKYNAAVKCIVSLETAELQRAIDAVLPPLGEERTALLKALIAEHGGPQTKTGQALARFKRRDDIKRRRTQEAPPTPVPDFQRWRLARSKDLRDWYYLSNTRYRRYPVPEGPMVDWLALVSLLRTGRTYGFAGTRLAWASGMGIYSARNHSYHGDRAAFAFNAEHAGAVADWLEAQLNIFLDKAKAPG